MNDAKTKISNTLFNNRQLFLRYNQYKIQRIQRTLSQADRLVFTLIPRLLHINMKGLPGYINEDVPCGIYNFEINPESQMAAERLFPSAILRGGESYSPFIHTLLLMGSKRGMRVNTRRSACDRVLWIRWILYWL